MSRMTYRDLVPLITAYEQWQQTKLKCQAAHIFKDPVMNGMCNGEVQFASVENSPGASEDRELQIIIGVGINYWQQLPAIFPTDCSPHLVNKQTGQLTVEDRPNVPKGSLMRQTLDLTFEQYEES